MKQYFEFVGFLAHCMLVGALVTVGIKLGYDSCLNIEATEHDYDMLSFDVGEHKPAKLRQAVKEVMADGKYTLGESFKIVKLKNDLEHQQYLQNLNEGLKK